MSRQIFDFEAPDRFVAGTTGDPGQRAFYLQARQGRALVTVAVEKVQVAALAGRLSQLLDAVDAQPGVTSAPRATRDDLPLDEPLVAVFQATVLALAWDPDADSVVIEAAPDADEVATAGEAADADEVDALAAAAARVRILRVRLDRGRARDFVRRAAGVVAAGRPSCPFCGQPIEATGHLCPRTSLN